MSLTRPSYAVNNIQTLADVTKDQATAVKVLHDKTGKDNKDYLTDVLLPELDTADAENVKLTGNQTVNGIKTFEEANGNWTGTLNGAPITSTEPGLSSAFNAHIAKTVKYVDDFFIAAESNQTQLLQRAFNYVKTEVQAGRKVNLKLTAGKVYNITSGLDFRFHKGCTLSGLGIIKVADSVNASTPLSYMLDMRNVDDSINWTGLLTIRDVVFDANNRATKIIEGVGADNTGLTYTTIDRCYFTGIKENSWGIYGVSYVTNIINSEFSGYGDDPAQTGQWRGKAVYVANSSNGLVIQNNNFRRLSRAIETSDSYGKTTISHNVFDSIRKAAIYSIYRPDLTIEDNYFENVGGEAETITIYEGVTFSSIKACIVIIGSISSWDAMAHNVAIKKNEFANCNAEDIIAFDRGSGLEVKENSIFLKSTAHNSLVKILKFGFGYYDLIGNYGAVIENNNTVLFDLTHSTGFPLVNNILDYSLLIQSSTIDLFKGHCMNKVVIKDINDPDRGNRKRKLPVNLYNKNFITDSAYTNYFDVSREIISNEVVYRFYRNSGGTYENAITIDPQFLARLKGTYIRVSFDTANSQSGAPIRFTMTDGVKSTLYLPIGNQTDKTLINEYQHMEFIFYVDKNATTLAFTPSSFCSTGNSFYIKSFIISPAGYDITMYEEIPYDVYASSVPTTGVWVKEDKIINSSSDPGEYSGWICTTSGDFSATPPVIKGYGLIQL